MPASLAIPKNITSIDDQSFNKHKNGGLLAANQYAKEQSRLIVI